MIFRRFPRKFVMYWIVFHFLSGINIICACLKSSSTFLEVIWDGQIFLRHKQHSAFWRQSTWKICRNCWCCPVDLSQKNEHQKCFQLSFPQLPTPPYPSPTLLHTHHIIIKNNSFVFRIIKYVNCNSFQLFLPSCSLHVNFQISLTFLLFCLFFQDSSATTKHDNNINKNKFSSFFPLLSDVLLFDMKYRYVCYVYRRRKKER